MKQLILILFAFLSLVAKAQDTTGIMPLKADTVHLSLTAAQHTFIVAFMPDKAQIMRAKYIYTITPQIEVAKDSTGRNYLVQPSKVITYAAPVDLLEDLFLLIGSHQERLVAAANRDIQYSLQMQLQRRPDVLQRLGMIVQMNAAHTDQVVQVEGVDYFAKLKE